MNETSRGTATVLVLGTGWWALNVVRALDRLGHRAIASDDGRSASIARHSRHAAEVWTHAPIATDPDSAIEALDAFLASRPDIDCVFPVGDIDLGFVAEHYDRIAAKARVIMVDPEIVRLCDDKAGLLQRGLDQGIPTRDFDIVADVAAVFAAARRHGFPCVVKARDSRDRLFDRKATIIESEAELAARFDRWPEGHVTLIVQSYARGPRQNIYLAADQGRLIAAVDVSILRTDEIDGTGHAVEGETVPIDPLLRQHTETLVASLGLHGIACAQFLVDPDTGEVCLIEINSRLGANFLVVEAAGVDLVALAMALGLPDSDRPALPMKPADYKAGVHYALSFLDFASLKDSWRSGKIGAWQALVWFARAMVLVVRADLHMSWSWRDPLPALVLFGRPVLRRLGLIN